jgi:hypothetical protein
MPVEVPDGKVLCPFCREVVRPDRLDKRGRCTTCITLARTERLPEPEDDDPASDTAASTEEE